MRGGCSGKCVKFDIIPDRKCNEGPSAEQGISQVTTLFAIALIFARSRGYSSGTNGDIGGFGACVMIVVVGGLLLRWFYKFAYGEGEKSSAKYKAWELERREKQIEAQEKSFRFDKQRFETDMAQQKENVQHEFTLAREMRKEAKDRFDSAYRDAVAKKEEELGKLLHDVQASHPDNKHLAMILTDAENLMLGDVIKKTGWSAPKTADKMLKKMNESSRKDRFEARFYKYQTALYEYLVPGLVEYADSVEDAATDAVKTEESDWLSDEEFLNLTPTERSQLALDRYVKSKNKSKWQIGRDYELYIGYRYRKDGWKVEQKGIKDGLEDLGRDLVCTKNQVTHVVQCKFWSQSKVIHEKHIAQLYGTTIAYKIENRLPLHGESSIRVVPVFVTSTEISEQATEFANMLGVKVEVKKDMGEFPRIKCNVGRNREKI